MEGGHHEVLCGKSESRQRKKRLLQQIREQLEFYFSPANISKDLFMSELLSESDYISLETFLKFNKIRSMTETVEMLRKAVGKSDILELSEDKTKLKLKIPYKPKEDELECTIYVEHLPNHADHDWVRKVFSQYGTIDYISLPRYRQTGRPKGFAFVEFQNPAMAQVALKAFGSHSYRSPVDTDPAELLSIKTYEGDQNISGMEIADPDVLESKKIQSNHTVSDHRVLDNSHTMKTEDQKEENVEDRGSCDEKENEDKRKLHKRNLEESEESEAKRMKMSYSSDCNEGVNSSKRKLGSTETEVDQENKKNPEEEKMEEGDLGSSKKKKKKRKRSKKEKEQEAEIIHLKVMSKQEWKTLRNRYLNMQKQNMQKLKRNMRFYRDKHRSRDYSEVDNGDEYYDSGEYAGTNYWHGEDDNGEYTGTNYCYGEGDSAGSSKRKDNGKFHNQTNTHGDKNRASSSVGKPEFIPGVLVKISFEEPLQDPKKLRETIREGGENVMYVDASARESEVIVRFAQAESANKYVEMGRWSRMEILSGSKEEEYWKHIISCWEVRRNKRGGVGLASTKHSSSSKQHHFSNHQYLRGKDKVIQKAFHQSNSVKPNHVVFTD